MDNNNLKDFEDCQWLSHAEFIDKDSVRITIVDNTTTNNILYTFNFSGEITCDGPIKEFTEFVQSHLKDKSKATEDIIRDILSGQAETLFRSRYVDEQGFTRIPQFIRGWWIDTKYDNWYVRYVIV